ncbi:MAG: sugar transferase [Vampirovibrionales bacterium]|jgi:lipopolysaccharide/colanic/teichoic acid biosynthesis glycosyltransferase|nr:sugar transferase [Vampirovibrionales bacterium]
MTNIATLDDLLTPFEAHASLDKADLLNTEHPVPVAKKSFDKNPLSINQLSKAKLGKKSIVQNIVSQKAHGVSTPLGMMEPIHSATFSKLEEELAQLNPHDIVDIVLETEPSQTPDILENSEASSDEPLVFEAIAVEAPVTVERPQVVSLGFAEETLDALTPQERHPEHALIKRVSDIIFAIVSLGLTAPFFAWVAFLSKSQDAERPVLVFDDYVGQFQQRISVPRFSIFDDIHTDSTFLVRASHALGLAHLPKLLSLYNGTLSLVGPALMRESDVQNLPTKYLERFQVLPGIFGLAQVLTKFYPKASLRAVAQFDLDYTQRWNLFLDVALLWSHLRTKDPHQKVAKKQEAPSPRRFQITVTY